MVLAPLLSSFRSPFELLAHSWMMHAKLARAAEPNDFEEILDHTIREVKFHSETLLTILFFLGTGTERTNLISWTLACLVFTLLTYTILEATSGDILHKSIDTIAHGRVILALLAKLPALSVLGTLCALAGCEWDTPFTFGVLCALAGVVLIVLSLRLRLHAAVCEGIALMCKRVKSIAAWMRRAASLKRPGAVDADEGGDEKMSEKYCCASTGSLADLPALPRAALLV